MAGGVAASAFGLGRKSGAFPQIERQAAMRSRSQAGQIG